MQKRLELGMSGLYDMLEAQTVRLDLVGKLISTNAQPLNQLKDTILNIEQELATIDLVIKLKLLRLDDSS